MQPSAKTANRVRFSLGVKISAVLVLVLLIVCAVTTYIVQTQVHKALHDEFSSKGVGIARGLATASVALIVRDDRTKIRGFVDEFSKTQGVAYIALNDPSGTLLSNSMGDQFPKALSDLVIKPEDMAAEATTNVTELDIPSIGKFLDISFPIMNGALGRAHVGMDLQVIRNHLNDLSARILGVFGVFLVVGLIVTLSFSRLMVRPLFAMTQVVGEVSNGNLRGRAEVASNDEFVILADSVNAMIGSLRSIVSSVRAASIQVNHASEEILATSRNQERGVTDQVQGLEEMAQTMKDLANTARAITENADSLTKVADDMSSDVQLGQAVLSETRISMTQIVEQNKIIADRINKLYEQSESIIAVIDIIDNISDRLDLLALNAALEGSRAGEVGKGFSLVAAEMRRLAESVSGSTKEIKNTIQDIHGLVRAALEASQHGSDTTQAGAQEMERTVEMMSRIFGLIERTNSSTMQIKVITQQQLSSSQQIAVAMSDVASISAQGVNAAQEVTRAATDLANLSNALQSQVSVFQVADGDAPIATVQKTAD